MSGLNCALGRNKWSGFIVLESNGLWVRESHEWSFSSREVMSTKDIERLGEWSGSVASVIFSGKGDSWDGTVGQDEQVTGGEEARKGRGRGDCPGEGDDRGGTEECGDYKGA